MYRLGMTASVFIVECFIMRGYGLIVDATSYNNIYIIIFIIGI
jgi:hypothetical protein